MLVYYLVLSSWFFYGLTLKLVFEDRLKPTNYILSILPIISIFILIAFRDISVGTDTAGYLIEYENAAYRFRALEYGYSILINFLSNIGITFRGFLSIFSLLVVFSVASLIRAYSKNLLLSYFIYITFGFFAFPMSGLRQALALCILIFAFLALMKNRKLIFLLMVILASTFHFSAWIFLPVILIRNIQISFASAVLIYLLCCSLFFFNAQIINFVTDLLGLRYFLEYADLNESVNPLVILLNGFIPLFALIFWPKPKASKIFSVFFIMSIINFALTIISIELPMINRLGIYFSIYSIILIVNILQDINSKNLRLFCISSMLILSMTMFSISIPGNSIGVDNYSFWFSELL